MTKQQAFAIQELLGHEWTDELVGFPWAAADLPAIVDEAGAPLAAQLSDGKVWFKVAHLAAFGPVTFKAARGGAAQPACASAALEGDAMVLSNGVIDVKVPAARTCAPASEGQCLPGPLMGLRRIGGPWIGAGSLCVSPDLAISAIRFETVEEGPHWCMYAVTYAADAARTYRVEYRLRAGCAHVEVHEHSSLCYEASWDLDIHPGLAPTRTASGHHPTADKTTSRTLVYDGRMHLGDMQAPDQNMHFFSDDFDIFSFAGEQGALCLAALDDGDWTYIPENGISMLPLAGPKLVLRASAKAGVRKWAVLLADAAPCLDEDFYGTPGAVLRRKYETTLDRVKDLVLEWEELPADQRPYAICSKEDVERARERFKTFEPLRRYGEFIDRDAELVQGQFDAGGHYPLNDERREDPMSAWLVAPDPAVAEKLKRALIEGLRIRVDAFLGREGHRAGIITSINLGRTLRPFMHMYDILAPHLAFTPDEKRYFMAAAAFLAYKSDDRHYWNADAIVLHSDHPRSCHRSAWFSSRESDWCTYNIDTAPHNFHVDVYTGGGSVALTFPRHPCARAWIDRTISFVERELDNWIFANGAFIESATYTLATMLWWVPFLAALKHAHIKNYFLDERWQRLCYGLTRLQGPYDCRIDRHSFTVMGDAMYPSGGANVLAWCAHLGREDSAYSSALMGAWERAGRQLNNPGQQGLSFYDALFIDPSLPGRPVTGLPSEHVDGLGLVLRHAHGTRDEVFFFIKCGKIYSHFHYDEGAFFVFADQVPLLDEYGVQYGHGTDEDGSTVPGHAPRCHNAISFSGTPTDRECYNRGVVTRFTTTPFADYAVCEMPVHLLHMKPDMSLWGFTGEEAPYGWWRRHILFVKPHGFFFYDEIESEFTATLDLNFKADRFESLGALSRVYKGRYGTDIPVCVNLPTGAPVRDGRVDMQAIASCFPKFSTMEKVPQAMKDTFYNQLSMHVATGPDTDFSWAFAWAGPDQRPRLAPLDGGAPGSVLTLAGREVRALVAPWLKSAVVHETEDFAYRGWAGAAVAHANGTREYLQLCGTRIGAPGGVDIEGDGPFRAFVRPGALVIETDGPARWLTISGTPADCVTCDGCPLVVERLASGASRITVPGGPHRFECR